MTGMTDDETTPKERKIQIPKVYIVRVIYLDANQSGMFHRDRPLFSSYPLLVPANARIANKNIFEFKR